MVYNIKEYKPISDTPLKKVQELMIARKIMELLNQNKYNNLEDFYQKNRSYQDFLKNNNMDTVVKHFDNTLNENEYSIIIGKLKEIAIAKQSFNNKNNINKNSTVYQKQLVITPNKDSAYNS